MNGLIASLVKQNAPPHILAALELFQFQGGSNEHVTRLTGAERHRFLQWCDIRQLTFAIPYVSGPELPAWASEAIFEKASRYELRFQRLKQELLEITTALDKAGLEFAMLKGLSHSPALSPHEQLRAQGDIDLWLLGSSVYEARDILSGLGYVSLLESRARHLAPMGRPSEWKWRGDLFDPEMPVSVELHHELWSERAEHIAIPDLNQFWERKQPRDFDGHKINVLCQEDLIGFAALHLLLHLLHGDLPLQRAWEIARFLHTHVSEDVFWTSWRSVHSPALRQLETAIFCLVTSWFQCDITQEVIPEFQDLPSMVRLWLEKCNLAPLTREWEPNKSEVWLHLALMTSRRKRISVLSRRLVPMSVPSFADRAEARPRRRGGEILKALRQIRFIRARIVHHLVTFVPTLWHGIRWL